MVLILLKASQALSKFVPERNGVNRSSYGVKTPVDMPNYDIYPLYNCVVETDIKRISQREKCSLGQNHERFFMGFCFRSVDATDPPVVSTIAAGAPPSFSMPWLAATGLCGLLPWPTATVSSMDPRQAADGASQPETTP